MAFLLSEKWSPCVPFLQILSFAFLLSPIEIEALQAIKASGRSDIVLKLEIVKKFVGILILIATIPLGIKAIAYGMLASQFFGAIVNTIPCRKLFSYSLWEQFKDVLFYSVLSILMFVLIIAVSDLWSLASWADIIVRVVIGISFYGSIILISRDDSFAYVISTIKEFSRKRNDSGNY